MIQQRLTERLISHWKLLKKSEYCPDFSRLNASAISDIWPSCLVIKEQPKGESPVTLYQFVEIGEKALSIFPENPVGTHFTANMKVMPAARLMRRVSELTVTGEPLLDDGQFVNEKHKVVKFRSCLVPFGTQERVTHVVVGLSWREF